MRPGSPHRASPVAIYEFPDRAAAEKAACAWISSMIPLKTRDVTPDVCTLRHDLDLAAIHAYAVANTLACVDWLQELSPPIGLGNLLWAFARAEGEGVEAMFNVLVEWLKCQEHDLARLVSGIAWRPSLQFSEERIASSEFREDEIWFQRRALAIFDDEVRLVVREWASSEQPAEQSVTEQDGSTVRHAMVNGKPTVVGYRYVRKPSQFLPSGSVAAITYPANAAWQHSTPLTAEQIDAMTDTLLRQAGLEPEAIP